MERKREPYKSYIREFKLEAVKLMAESKRSSSEVAREQGIRRKQLYKRRDQLVEKGDHAFSGRGRPTKEKQSELTSLKQENT